MSLKVSLFLAVIGFCLFASNESYTVKDKNWNKKKQTCPDPYSKCNLGKDGMINVHIVPHTHDDVGWLKTVDQYYYGSNTGQQEASVQYILDNVVSELAKDPARRFVYVEIAYFWRWWNQQNDEIKQLVRELVDERRLEFVIGAWCMNDEASTYYQDIIDQQTLGLQFILKEFGECARPKAAWQVDPFGHSREQASLFAQFGFDGLFLGRLDFQDDNYRSQTKTRETIWQASNSLAYDGQIFTGILPHHYGPPGGFCFDAYCKDEPIMDDPRLDEYNVNEKVDLFINTTLSYQNVYKTNNLIMTMGEDFQYSNALMWFKNLDKLIYYVNQRQINGSKINIFYSTTSCYLYSLYKANLSWDVKVDDFFPYASREHAFWTGYFTSRTTLKYYVRQTNGFLQATRHFAAIAQRIDNDTKEAFGVLERAMGVAQHHDAVSGTERQHVAYDYAKQLSVGTDQCVQVVQNIIDELTLKNSNGKVGESIDIIYCPLLNITECLPIENLDFIGLFTYNPLGQAVDVWVRVPVVEPVYEIINGSSDTPMLSEFIPISNETKNLPDRKSKAQYDMLFKASLDPLRNGVYMIRKTNITKKKLNKPEIKRNFYENFIFQNEYLSLQFDFNGNLIDVVSLDTGLKTIMNQSYCYYQSYVGDNSSPDKQASGAYIFRPNGTDICLSIKQFMVLKGNQYQEIRQVYNEWISQTIRLYDGAQSIEFEWQVGPINVNDSIGKEVIVKFFSDIQSKSIFYTDSNGREILRRGRNDRPWPNFNQTEAVAGNYYPINSRIFIQDEQNADNVASRQLTFVTDRTHGGSSIKDGSVEIMLHRRLLHDDRLGVAEPLNEPGSDNKGLIARGKFYVLFNTTQNSVRLHRELAHKINTPPLLVFFLEDSKEPKNFNQLKTLSRSNILNNGLPLPDNVHLLTLMYDFNNANGSALIIRLEHFYELLEDPVLSRPVTVNLYDIFGDAFDIAGVEELALGANMPVEELENRLKFTAMLKNAENLKSKISSSNRHDNNFKAKFDVTLRPMQIRTYRLYFEPRK